MAQPNGTLPFLPPAADLESKEVLRKAASAHRQLALLNGYSHVIPNQGILINTLSLQEAKDSSAIENIITSHDDLFQADVSPEYTGNAAAKEVSHYVDALKKGFDKVVETGVLTAHCIAEIQAILERNDAGFRRLPGTVLKNDRTGETVYVPPQDHQTIVNLMSNLERFINDDTFYSADPLVKLAVIHYQFESIHPFYDGNGRTGRIINVLYLVLKKLLDIPILYLSRHITNTKDQYYSLLQKVRDENAWEAWILYMLDAIEQTSMQTVTLIEKIRDAYSTYQTVIKDKHKFYSQDLINNIFFHPYTKIEFIMKDLNVSRLTATKYLNQLAEDKMLHKIKRGKSNYYVNIALFVILTGSKPGNEGEEKANGDE